MIDYNELRRLREKFNVLEENIEKDYLIELLLGYISLNNHLSKHLVFRGGTALKKVFFPKFRYSEDLDFIVKPSRNLSILEQTIKETINKINEELPVELDIKEILYPQRGHLQLFLSYDIVSEIRTPKELKIDIIEDSAVLKSKVRKIVFTYKDFIDLNRSLITYDLESIAAEKILRIMDVVDEPRDLWDLSHLLKSKIKPDFVKKRFVEKTGFDINLENLIRAIKKPNYRKTWEIRLRNQISFLPEYDVVVKDLEFLLLKLFSKDKNYE